MRLTKWLALLLSMCLMFAMVATALSEEDELVLEDAESAAEEAEAAGEEIEITLDALEGAEMEEAEEAQTPDPGEGTEITAPTSGSGLHYAKATKADAPVYMGSDGKRVIARLDKNDVVLYTGDTNGLAVIALNASGKMVVGYMRKGELAALSDSEAQTYFEKVSRGGVGIYDNHLDFPLGPVGSTSYQEVSSIISNYTSESNNKVYIINGKEIYANLVESQGMHNCWKWARKIYDIIWGVKFDSTFEGTAKTGMNLLRNLSDEERTLTPEHLKYFVTHAKPGATLRVTDCVSTCTKFATQDGYCSNNSAHTHIHSLIIADIREDGMVTMDNANDRIYTRFYTWADFCSKWAKWDHIKYIKYPNAPALKSMDSTVAVTGVSLSQTSLALLKGGTATLTATIEPEDATTQDVTWASSDNSVATVADGVVTGVAGGTATITVTTADGGKKATCQVQVAQADTSKTLSKTGSNGTVQMILGQQMQLVPKFATSKGWKIKSVNSSKSSCASVSSAGIVTAKKVGTATITVKTKNGKQATLKVKVVDPNTPTAITLNKSGTVKLKVGGTLKLYTKLSPSTATSMVVWKSSKPKVASVDSEGNVVALGKGTCYIGVMTENKKYDTVKIKVG